MTEPDVVIVASGGANIASLQFALQRLGAKSRLSADPAQIRAADRVILPGVGAAADAMQRLRDLALDTVLPELRQPVLGICLGMQILFERSEEGATTCLGILPGEVTRFERLPTLPVPHMGWNTIDVMRRSPLLSDVQAGEFAYFVHSFAAPVGADTIASTDYGRTFSACVQARNFFGVQFHPERSAGLGAKILRNFLRDPPCD
jgi:imidazole glycerol-phosphate synthase subunit HisH